MKVLVTGGTGLVGGAVVPALLRREYEVRLGSRHARSAAERLRASGLDVEAFDADVTVDGSLRGAADGCDVVIHLVGVIDAHGDERAYVEVNENGTRRSVEEAKRAGARRFVHVSALGADRATTAYQRSKRASEQAAAAFGRGHVILRPGGVYGPKDQVLTLLLRMLRASPVVPMIGSGMQRWQPIWHADLGEALAVAAERPDLEGRVLEVAGDEVITPRELVDALGELIDRRPRYAPIPAFVAPLASRALERFGFTPPLNEAKVAMLLEGSVVEPPSANALRDPLGIVPTPLAAGLRAVLHDLPLQPLASGIGPIHHKTYRAPVSSPSRSPEQVIGAFRERCVDVMPLDFGAERGASRRLDQGATLALHLPLRGNMLMRVVDVAAREVTIATVEGHPIAGVVRFAADESDGELGFVVDVYARASNWLDRAAIGLGGSVLQDINWRSAALRGARLACGEPPRHVQRRTETLRGEEARRVEDAIGGLARTVERPATMV